MRKIGSLSEVTEIKDGNSPGRPWQNQAVSGVPTCHTLASASIGERAPRHWSSETRLNFSQFGAAGTPLHLRPLTIPRLFCRAVSSPKLRHDSQSALSWQVVPLTPRCAVQCETWSI